jgi:hypothetical protein
MCGGGFLGLGPAPKAPKMPDAVVPAPPAPERKQDTGAIVAIGDSNAELEMQRKRASGVKTKGGSGLGIAKELL